MIAAMSLLLGSCTDYGENFHEGADDKPDTVSGSTRPADDDPDTVSGSTRPADGSVVKGRIGTGSITIDGQTYTDVYGIDFNKDGVLEYRIIGNGVSLVYNVSDNNVVVSSGCIATMAKHSSVNAMCNFAGDGNTPLPSLGSLPEKFYVGCRITLSDGVHYGWVKVKYDDGELEWDKCAYNTSPDSPVTAGDD